MVIFLLKITILILIAILTGFWVSIFICLEYRKIRLKQLSLIETTFANVTANYLYPSPGVTPDLIQIQRSLRKAGITSKKTKNVQYLIDLMIRTQRSLLGQNYKKLDTLYHQIPPYRVSVNKLKSKKWWIKARGIREIYEMDQEQYIKEITKERNNKNIFVRREAQIAMVVFLGWESLRFLPYLKRQMSLWQQIKVVEKLFDLHKEPNPILLRKAFNSEKPYANELIMRIIRKFDMKEDLHYIIGFLDSPVFDTRESAIYCISSFTLDADQMREVQNKFFLIPNIEQQVHLLKYLDRISEVKELDFYKSLLYLDNDVIKLTAAEILWNNGFKEEVQNFYYQQYTTELVNA